MDWVFSVLIKTSVIFVDYFFVLQIFVLVGTSVNNCLIGFFIYKHTIRSFIMK